MQYPWHSHFFSWLGWVIGTTFSFATLPVSHHLFIGSVLALVLTQTVIPAAYFLVKKTQ